MVGQDFKVTRVAHLVMTSSLNSMYLTMIILTHHLIQNSKKVLQYIFCKIFSLKTSHLSALTRCTSAGVMSSVFLIWKKACKYSYWSVRTNPKDHILSRYKFTFISRKLPGILSLTSALIITKIKCLWHLLRTSFHNSPATAHIRRNEIRRKTCHCLTNAIVHHNVLVPVAAHQHFLHLLY